MTSPFGTDQDRVILEPDTAQDILAFLWGEVGGTFRAAAIACYFTKAISRVGIAYYPKGDGGVGATAYVTTTSYLGDEPIGGNGDTTIIGPNADGNNVMYVDVIPADRVWLNIGLTVLGAPHIVEDHWRFTVIGSNNEKLGVHPS